MVSAAYLTPPQLAKILAVKVQRIHGWLKNGELRGLNVGDKHRPRWRISPEAIAAFEATRSSQPAPKPARRSRRMASATPEYF